MSFSNKSSSMISSTSSVQSNVSSEGLVNVTSISTSTTSSSPEIVEKKGGVTSSSYTSSTDSEDGCCSSRHSGEEVESVEGLVLMGSTRLRPAQLANSDNISKARLYIQTYNSMFGRKDCTPNILPLALHGNLQNNPFRSVCWRVLLNVIPSSSLDWVSTLYSIRNNYKFIQEKFHTEEKIKDATLDPSINNPLSQAEESPWNQHFQDGELRKVIKQDVVRTFPEVSFFQSQVVRDTLVNILFVFAKCHPEISYRQGMHELLAPLYYVVKSDCDVYATLATAADNSKEAKAVAADLAKAVNKEIFNNKFCEADTFSLFEALMEAVGPWFITTNSVHSASSGCEGRPWSRPQDKTTGNKLVDTLNYIQDVLIKRHDPALFQRLEKLEIFPQIYGIRWLRLLFGREFAFRDTLLLWDAIFADNCPPSLCDQLVVSLLMSVRDLLLKYEYQDAVQLLMKLPSNLCVTYCIQFALHLKDPIRFPKPSGSAFAHGFVTVTKEKKLVKPENKFRKITVPKVFTQSQQKHNTKAPFELVRPSKAVETEEENDSDFTLLNVKNEVEVDRSVINVKSERSKPHANAKVRVNANTSEGSSTLVRATEAKSTKTNTNESKVQDCESDSREMDGKVIELAAVRTDLENVVFRLEGLLTEETLLRRKEILESLGRMKSLLTMLPEDKQRLDKELLQIESRGTESGAKVTTLAVDVAKYFEE